MRASCGLQPSPETEAAQTHLQIMMSLSIASSLFHCQTNHSDSFPNSVRHTFGFWKKQTVSFYKICTFLTITLYYWLDIIYYLFILTDHNTLHWPVIRYWSLLQFCIRKVFSFVTLAFYAVSLWHSSQESRHMPQDFWLTSSVTIPV